MRISLIHAICLALISSCALLAQSNPVPFVNSPLVPAAAVPGNPGFMLTVNGTGFVSGATVTWNGQTRVTTFLNSSTLQARILAVDVKSPRTALVRVKNPVPGGGTSNAAIFLVTNPISIPSFSRQDTTLDNYNQEYVATGDFNGDSRLDAVFSVAHYFNSETDANVYLSKGDGTLQLSQAKTNLGSFPSRVAVGDFNNDANLDFVIGVYGYVIAQLGNGHGSFTRNSKWPSTGSVKGIAIGDLNGDGKLDVATTDDLSPTLSILLGNGDGTFQPPTTYTTGSDPSSVAVGDFNRDGKLDLAVANGGSSEHTVSILLGNGDGTFQPQQQFTTGPVLTDIAVADLNGDGLLDIAVPDNFGNAATVLLGNGDGTFQSHVEYFTGRGPSGIALADINGDGVLDMMTGDTGGRSLSVFLGKGDGTFQSRISFPAPNVASPFDIGITDLNGDGRLDLVTTSGTFSFSIYTQQ